MAKTAAAAAAPDPKKKDEVSPALLKKLKAMKDKFNKAKAESKKGGGSGTTASPGRHATRLTDCRLLESDKGPSVKFEFTVIEGDDTGEKATRYAGFDTDERLTYLCRDFRRLGVDVDELEPEEIPDLCKELTKQAPTVRVNVKENGEYTNVYIDKLIEVEGGDEAAAEAEPEEAAAEADAEPDADAAVEGADDEAAPDEDEIDVGDSVSYLIGKKKQTGTVFKMKGDELFVKNDASGEKETVAKDEATKLAAAE